jgi:hypothetical protein
MTKKNVDEIISMAKALTKKTAATDAATDSSPELMDAIQSVAAQIKQVSGGNTQLTALVEQVQALVKDAK